VAFAGCTHVVSTRRTTRATMRMIIEPRMAMRDRLEGDAN
jgi:hypothetical protein